MENLNKVTPKKIETLEDFVKLIPKSDLHVHLDGSIRMQTLIDIAKKENIKMPTYTVDGLNQLVFKDQYANLPEYLQGFDYTIKAMQKPEYLEQVAYEFAMDNINEGVCYVEPRFAPQFHMGRNMDIETVFTSISRGLDKAKKEYNNSDVVKSGELPPFHYGLIACAMRAFGPGLSNYFDNMLDAHSYSTHNEVFALTSYELARAVVKVRDKLGLPIVALDLAGAEAGNPAGYHRAAYQYAHKNFMNATVHAGEAYGPESIFQAITELYAERIGHGYYLFADQMVTDEDIEDKKAYVKALAEYIASRRVTIEVCLTSNMQTNPTIGDIKKHQYKKMLESRLSTTICTDNRTVSKTNVTKEILLAIKNFDLHGELLKGNLVYGFKRSFFPGSYSEKRQYVKKVIDRFERLASLYEGSEVKGVAK